MATAASLSKPAKLLPFEARLLTGFLVSGYRTSKLCRPPPATSNSGGRCIRFCRAAAKAAAGLSAGVNTSSQGLQPAVFSLSSLRCMLYFPQMQVPLAVGIQNFLLGPVVIYCRHALPGTLFSDY